MNLKPQGVFCTGFNGIVLEPEKYGQLCAEYFGATKVAVIDDGFVAAIREEMDAD